jgi:P-type E1-E2 ATPase
MEILVAIAIVACYLSGDLILSVLIPLILNVAHLLEERSIMGGREAIDGLKRMRQDSAVLLEGDVEKTVEASSLTVGQIIVVKPGAGIPIDGKVISGETNVDQKSLTGEPLPAHIKVGDNVYAGTVNIDGRILVEVEKAYVDTSFSNILTMLEEAENISIPESRLIDRFMKYYIPFVLALASAVALITNDLSKAIAILVVSCPCGQMLVSSAPMIAALSAATKRGILIKNSKFIEELTDIDVVVFDKTGTVTVGDLSLTEAVAIEGVSREELMSAAANVASASAHPISRALMASIGELEYAKDYKVTEVSGKGMDGTSKDGKHNVKFGNADWIRSFGVEVDEAEGVIGSVSYVLCDGKLLGYLCFNDTARKEAKEGIDTLKSMGIEKTVMLTGSERLFERPLDVYEELCRENDFTFKKDKNSVVLCGRLNGGSYKIRGGVSSQFISGLLFALVYLGEPSSIEIIPPFESRSYVFLTISALNSFGADVSFGDEYKIEIRPSHLHAFSGKIEGDYSNAAFLDAFNRLGSEINIGNLDPDSLQGDRVYIDYFDRISNGTPTLDISDCPDLGPVLFALAALKEGATFTGTDRLKAKESDRGAAMHQELLKLGGGLIFGDNMITVPKQELKYGGFPLDGHNDHRIVMSLSVILSVIGGEINGVEAVKKSYPGFFDDVMRLGAEVEFI